MLYQEIEGEAKRLQKKADIYESAEIIDEISGFKDDYDYTKARADELPELKKREIIPKHFSPEVKKELRDKKLVVSDYDMKTGEPTQDYAYFNVFTGLAITDSDKVQEFN